MNSTAEAWMVHHPMVTSYRQYCPVARASEILSERWTLLIVRNLLFGATTFSAIAGGVPAMSRSLLAKRLRGLERSGVIEVRPKSSGRGSLYQLTPAGRDLLGVIESMGRWAETWVHVLPEHADPGFALWAWCQVQLDRGALPPGRVVVQLEFPEERPGDRFYWLLIQQGEAEVCLTDPGISPDLFVVARSRAFVDWHRGVLPWSEALERQLIEVSGPRRLARAMPTWNTHAPRLPVG